MGIGPQNLGAQGMSGNSKPCGSPLKKISNPSDGEGASPLAFNDKLEAAASNLSLKAKGLAPSPSDGLLIFFNGDPHGLLFPDIP